MRRSNENSSTHSEPSSGLEMKYLLGLFCLQWDRPNHTMYYEELLPRNVQNRILFFTGVGYYKTVQSEHGATFFQFFLIKVIQIFQCWSQIIIQTRSEDIAIINRRIGQKGQAGSGYLVEAFPKALPLILCGTSCSGQLPWNRLSHYFMLYN